MSTVTAFFMTKPRPLSPAERRAKARAKAKASLTKRERAAILAYQRADAAERKRLLRNQVSAEQQARLVAFKLARRNYMRLYRAMRGMATTLL